MKHHYYMGFVCAMIALSLLGLMSRISDTRDTPAQSQMIKGRWQDINDKNHILVFSTHKVKVTDGKTRTYHYKIANGQLTIGKRTYKINALTDKKLLFSYRRDFKVKAFEFKKI